MTQTISVGLIGCGKIAEIAHMPAYQVIKKAQLVAVADSNIERAKWLANRFRVKSYYSDPMEIIERKDIEAIDICLPAFLHSKYILAAASMGKHIFCEKPMALNVNEAQIIIQKIEESKISLMVGFNQRFETHFKKMKDLIEQNLLGKIISVEIKYAKCDSPERYLPPNWRADPLKGGGVLLDLACHKIDQLRWFLGEVKSVSAMKAHYLKADAEDTGVIILDFHSGSLGYLSVCLICSSPFSELDYTNVYGRNGTVRYNSERGQLIQIYIKGSLLGRTSDFVNLSLPSKKSSYIIELETFFDSIITGKKPPVSSEDAMKVLEIVEAARESAMSGKTIYLRN